MAEFTPMQHAQLVGEYLDELLDSLKTHRWCFFDTYGLERKISHHAEALGITTPLDRPSTPEHETGQELQIWLRLHDPLTDSRHERLIITEVFAPPPASKGTVAKTLYRPLNGPEQVMFQQFVDRLKREVQRLANIRTAQPGSVQTTRGDDGVEDVGDLDSPAGDPHDTRREARNGNRMEWLAMAMLMVRDHPDWSDAEIARRVEKNAGTLSRSKEYQTAASLARGSKTDRPAGYITVAPDSGLADVEAVAPSRAPADDRPDRGEPIPGSRYSREYCAECDEPIAVMPDKVGKRPVCDRCAG